VVVAVVLEFPVAVTQAHQVVQVVAAVLVILLDLVEQEP
jgi:hypothetical protein